MKSKNLFLSIATVMMLLFTASKSEAQNAQEPSNASVETKIEVIQFHSEHRCMTCNKIEELSRKTVKDFANISFYLVNVDDEKNEEKAEEFEAFGTALFLYNPTTGAKKDLTEFAFMNAGDETKFIEDLKKEIRAFQKS